MKEGRHKIPPCRRNPTFPKAIFAHFNLVVCALVCYLLYLEAGVHQNTRLKVGGILRLAAIFLHGFNEDKSSDGSSHRIEKGRFYVHRQTSVHLGLISFSLLFLKHLVYEISTKKKLICLTYHKAQNYLKHREKNSTFKRLHTKTV